MRAIDLEEAITDGEVITTTGYYAVGDGGHMTYRWDAASTATDNGGTIILPDGHSGPGRWIAIFEKTHINARWFGVRADNTTDDTAAIQSAIDTAIDSGILRVILPTGDIRVTDTIHMGYGNESFSMIELSAESAGRPSYFVWGTKLRPTFTDRPVVNIQGGRHCSIQGIGFVGTLATTSMYTATGLPASEAAWDAVVPTHRFRQCCAISIDAYSGEEPTTDPHYENAPFGWSRWHSSDVRIRDCHIQQFGCGVITKPSGGDGNGDYVIIEDCSITGCKYAFSVNGSQTRQNTVKQCKIVDCFAAIGRGYFGPQATRDTWLINSAVEGCAWWTIGQNTDWSGKVVIRDCFGERCRGFVDLQNAAGNTNITIEDNSFVMHSGDDSVVDVRHHVRSVNAHLTFQRNRVLNEQPTRPAVTFWVSGIAAIRDNTFRRTAANYNAPLYAVLPNTTLRSEVDMNSGTDLIVSRRQQNGALLSGASYSGNRVFTGTQTGVTVLARVGEYIAHSTLTDITSPVFRLESRSGSTVTLLQVTDCTADDVINSAASLTSLATSKIGVVLQAK